jgi:hypothetical protein
MDIKQVSVTEYQVLLPLTTTAQGKNKYFIIFYLKYSGFPTQKNEI